MSPARSSSLFGAVFGAVKSVGSIFKGKPKDPNESPVYVAKLGEELGMYFDESTKKWVRRGEKAEPAANTALPPPPMGFPPQSSPTAGPPVSAPPTMSANSFPQAGPPMSGPTPGAPPTFSYRANFGRGARKYVNAMT